MTSHSNASSFWSAALVVVTLLAGMLAPSLAGSVQQFTVGPIAGVPAVDVRLQTLNDETDRGLEVRVSVGSILVEFPWLKYIPVKPARRLLLFVRSGRGPLPLSESRECPESLAQ